MIREDMKNLYWDYFGYGAIPTQTGVEIIWHKRNKKKIELPSSEPSSPIPPTPPTPCARPTTPIPILSYIYYPIISFIDVEDEYEKIPNTFIPNKREIYKLLNHLQNDNVTTFEDANKLRELLGYEKIDFMYYYYYFI